MKNLLSSKRLCTTFQLSSSGAKEAMRAKSADIPPRRTGNSSFKYLVLISFTFFILLLCRAGPCPCPKTAQPGGLSLQLPQVGGNRGIPIFGHGPPCPY